MGSSGVTQQTELLKIWAIQDTEVTPRDRFEGTWQYIRRYLAADSAARRLQLNTEAGTTQSSVQKQQDPTKDLADEISALLKQRYHPADRIIEKFGRSKTQK